MRDEYYRTLNEAIAEFTEHGYDSEDRVAYWLERLRKSAEKISKPHEMEQMLRDALVSTYRKLIERGGIVKRHPGVERFTLERLRPELRAELDRRIAAAANLIRNNRTEAIQKTLQRFSGWATSIPKGGTAAKAPDIKKTMRSLPFDERRVIVDQGHKLTASLHNVLATDGGAIAGVWHSNFRQAGYNYREDHKDRDGNVYLMRDSWADKQGFVKGEYYDKITAVAEEPFCRCYLTYKYALSELPRENLTKKGIEAIRDAAQQQRRK